MKNRTNSRFVGINYDAINQLNREFRDRKYIPIVQDKDLRKALIVEVISSKNTEDNTTVFNVYSMYTASKIHSTKSKKDLRRFLLILKENQGDVNKIINLFKLAPVDSIVKMMGIYKNRYSPYNAHRTLKDRGISILLNNKWIMKKNMYPIYQDYVFDGRGFGFKNDLFRDIWGYVFFKEHADHRFISVPHDLVSDFQGNPNGLSYIYKDYLIKEGMLNNVAMYDKASEEFITIEDPRFAAPFYINSQVNNTTVHPEFFEAVTDEMSVFSTAAEAYKYGFTSSENTGGVFTKRESRYCSMFSSSFKRFLLSISYRDRVAERLLQVIFDINFPHHLSFRVKQETVSYSRPGKAIVFSTRRTSTDDREDSSKWDRSGRDVMKPGRIAKVILDANNLGSGLDAHAYEEFTNKFKSLVKEGEFEFVEVRGEEIKKYYHEKNYYYGPGNATGTLHKSCMRSGDNLKQLGLYCMNSNCSMLILRDRIGDKTMARAIMWSNPIINGVEHKGVKIVDRIYTATDDLLEYFIDHVKANKYWYKKIQSAGSQIYIDPNGLELKDPAIKIPLEYTNFALYPWIDTFRTMCMDHKYLYNLTNSKEGHTIVGANPGNRSSQAVVSNPPIGLPLYYCRTLEKMVPVDKVIFLANGDAIEYDRSKHSRNDIMNSLRNLFIDPSIELTREMLGEYADWYKKHGISFKEAPV